MITGHVTDDAGKPIAAARVFTRDREAKTDKDGALSTRRLRSRKTATGGNGKGPGHGHERPDRRAQYGAGRLPMKPGGKIRIRVLNKEGQPIPSPGCSSSNGVADRSSISSSRRSPSTRTRMVCGNGTAPLDQLLADICPPDGMQLPRQNITAREKEYVFHPLGLLVISGTVTDAKTKQPIKSFRVIPGTRYGPDQLFWNRQEAYTAKDGKYQMRDNRVDGLRVIRVEAEGYKPSMSENIKAEYENVSLDFQLEQGADIQGIVLTPDGKPAAGRRSWRWVSPAQISIRNGDVGDSSTYAARVETDKSGKFHFPAQDNAFTLVVTHSSGFAKIDAGTEWKQNTVKLEPWAHIEGTFHVGKKAAPHVTLEIQESDFNEFRNEGPHIFSQHEATTDGEGNFVFERVRPGKGYIGRRIIFMVNEGATEVASSRKERF